MSTRVIKYQHTKSVATPVRVEKGKKKGCLCVKSVDVSSTVTPPAATGPALCQDLPSSSRVRHSTTPLHSRLALHTLSR